MTLHTDSELHHHSNDMLPWYHSKLYSIITGQKGSYFVCDVSQADCMPISLPDSTPLCLQLFEALDCTDVCTFNFHVTMAEHTALLFSEALPALCKQYLHCKVMKESCWCACGSLKLRQRLDV